MRDPLPISSAERYQSAPSLRLSKETLIIEDEGMRDSRIAALEAEIASLKERVAEMIMTVDLLHSLVLPFG